MTRSTPTGESELRTAGLGWIVDEPREMAGVSCFLRDGDQVFHTYSTFGRGTEPGTCTLLDLTALGRQEEWEEPKGRVPAAHPNQPFFEPAPIASAEPVTASAASTALLTLAQKAPCC
ncbi:hypothetical protein HDA40_002482 [Hamadaea flava]|uniref:DUF899 family protein n=1 Tax=Hamadaea flava TaxID=1742688 RepID=A0ABV8LP10_9ACTN|nr:DUF899 family protein [Hamadaea flava]MCP2323975.1 hypothetical protein [Hamadaea flava]